MPAKAKGPARVRKIVAQATTVLQGKATRLLLTPEMQSALAHLHKTHGEGLVVKGNKIPPAKHSPTGVFPIDLALCGGFAEGFASMLYGFESSGKTLLALLAAAGYQKKHPDKVVVFVDAEKLYNPEWATLLGVDTERLHVVTPDTGQQAVDTIRELLKVDMVGMIILDSIPACVPLEVDERSAEDKTMGALAALMGILCSKIIVSWGSQRRRGHYVSVLLLNQNRMKIGGFVRPGMPPPTTLPGGRQINHLPTTKLALRKIFAQATKKGKDGQDVNDKKPKFIEIGFKLEKKKHGGVIDEGAFMVVTAGGHALPPGTVDDAAAVVSYAFRFNLATGGGGHFRLQHFTDEVFRKKEHLIQWVREEPEQAALLRATIIAAMRKQNGMNPFPPDDSLEFIQNISLKIPDGALEAACAGIEPDTDVDSGGTSSDNEDE